MKFLPFLLSLRVGADYLQVSRAGVVLFFLTLYCSKGAAIALTYRFAPLRRHKITVFAAFGFTLLLGLVSVLVLNVSCGLTGALYWHIARDSSHCQNQVRRSPRCNKKTLTLS